MARRLSTTTRRRFLQAGAASAGAWAGLGWLRSSGGVEARPDRPNVVLIVIDTLRADHAFGPRAHTPNIDALAREGMRFTNVYPEAMPTVPARRTLLTGRRVFPFRAWHPYDGLLGEPGWAPIADVGSTFTSALRRAGYWTGYVTDNTFLGFSPAYADFRASFDAFIRRGGQVGGSARGVSDAEVRRWVPPPLADPQTRDRVRRYLANGRYEHDETRSFAARVFRDGAALLETAARARPFALVVDTFEPHEPWTPPRRYVDLYGDPDYRGPEPARPYYAPVSRYMDGAEAEVLLERMRALYAAEVTMTDRWLGVFLDRLHQLRLARDTAVILVSDHGFFLGDHGLTGKISTRLYPELIHVPLVVVDRHRRRAGESSDWFASTHDVGPTLLSMAGVPPPPRMDGADLSLFFDGRVPAERPYAYGGYGNCFHVRSQEWAMFGTNRGDGFHLFDTRADPGEARDLSGARPDQVAALYDTVRRSAGGPLPVHRET
jgi:arylsulfatase A-like enzyme